MTNIIFRPCKGIDSFNLVPQETFMIFHPLKFALVNERLQTVLEVVLGQFFTHPEILSIDVLGRNQYIADNLNDTISSNAIFDRHGTETVDLDGYETPITSNINAQCLVFK